MHFLAWLSSQLRSKLRLLKKKMEELKHGHAAEEERYTYRPTLEWNPQVRWYLSKAYGQQRFAQISDALTRPSCYSCIRVNVLKTTHKIILQRLSSLLYEAKFYKGDEMETLHHMRTVNPNSESSTSLGALEKLHDIFDELNMEGMAEVYNVKASRSATSSLPTNGMDKSSSLVDSLHSSFSYKDLLYCKIPGMEYVIIVRGSGPCKIDYGTGSGKVLKEVIISRKCAEAVLRGAHVFVPGVLACSAHVEKGDTVAVCVAIEHPDTVGGWMVGITRGTVLSGTETDVYYRERNGLYIGRGITMMSRVGIFRETQGIAIEMVNRVYRLPPFHGALKGEIFLQNLPSIITAHVLDPKQGERILDLCAAPGGKTTAIAMLMKDKGEIVAIDRSHNKVMDIQNLAQEMGLTCVRAYKLDALKAVRKVNPCDAECSSLSLLSTCKQMDKTLYTEHASCSSGGEDNKHLNYFQPIVNLKQDQSYGDIKSSNEGRYTSKVEERKVARKLKNGPGRSQDFGGRVEQSKGFEPNSFDRVLLDAPCSALGLRPRLFAGEETLQSLRNHGRYQRRMFDQAVQLVGPGGTIVYSTCTINPGENEALVRYALDTYSFLSLVPQYPKIGGPGLVGGQDVFDGQSYEEWLRDGEQDLVQRFCPSSDLDTIGFFIAKFKVGEKEK